MARELLIVGLDPGITTAYAVLNSSGNVIKLKSAKRLTLGSLIKELLEVNGKIIAVGSDVKYSPHYVEKFCSAFSAKLIVPKEDMKVGFKERITSQYKTNDDHQRDALAAAIFALNELHPLFQKVESHLKRDGKEHLTNDVKELVVKGWNIADAIDHLEKKNYIIVTRKRNKQKISKSKRIFEENNILKSRNERLSSEIEFLKDRLQNLEKNASRSLDSRMKSVIEIKDRKITSLKKILEEERQKEEHTKEEAARLKFVLMNLEGKIVVKRFAKLGKELINLVKENEIIFVDDPSSISEAAMGYLKSKAIKMITNTKPPLEVADSLTVVNGNNIHTEAYDAFVIIKKEELERELKNKDVLYKIIKEYRESRS